MNIKNVINEILTHYTEEDKRLNSKAISEWDKAYFKNFQHNWPLLDMIKLLRKFQESKGNKDDFEHLFKLEAKNYIDPKSFDYKLSKEAVLRISQELEPYLEFTQEEISIALDQLFTLTHPGQWTFDRLGIKLSYIDKTREASIQTESILGHKKYSA